MLTISKELEANGFTLPQATILAEKLVEVAEKEDDSLVTKDYLKSEIAEVRVEIRDSKIEIIKWIIGAHIATFIASLSLLSGLNYFLWNVLIFHP